MRRILVSLALGACFIAGVASAETIERSVKANARTPVGGIFVYWVQACTQGAIPDPRISDAPKNGTVEIEMRQVRLTKETNCTGNVKGPVFVYAPKKGFKGKDEFTVEYPYARSESSPPILMNKTYRLTVE